MKTYLVTGAAGFIGANYIKYILAKHDDIKVVILDALTYAGNLGTIAKDIDDERCFFVKGDICDRILADELFSKYKFDYVVNFAAESHVDRSIENPQLELQAPGAGGGGVRNRLDDGQLHQRLCRKHAESYQGAYPGRGKADLSGGVLIRRPEKGTALADK